MNKLLCLLVIGACAVLCGLNSANAQAPAPAAAPAGIAEIYACNFNDNKHMSDLLAVAGRWSAWADRHNMTDYNALIMQPYVYSPDITYDALWVGAWPSGAAMGAGEATWFAEGKDLQAQFDAVADCGSHAHYATIPMRTPAGPPPTTGGLVSFEDCKLHEGRTIPEAIAAGRQWLEYLAGMGSDTFSVLLIPLAGQTKDANFAFKVVTGFGSVQAYGKYLDVYTGGGFRKADELFGRLLDCDSARVYTSNRIRSAAAN